MAAPRPEPSSDNFIVMPLSSDDNSNYHNYDISLACIHTLLANDQSSEGYRIAQNFGRVNFWRLVARHAIGREKFGESSTTGIHKSTHVSCLQIWRGKLLR